MKNQRLQLALAIANTLLFLLNATFLIRNIALDKPATSLIIPAIAAAISLWALTTYLNNRRNHHGRR